LSGSQQNAPGCAGGFVTRERLLTAVSRFRPGFGHRELYEQYVLSTLSNVVDALADAPVHRKALIYISGGIFLNMEAIASPNTMERFGDQQGRMGRHLQKLLDLFQKARQADVNIYSIDPYGLTVSDRKLARDFLETLASNTGGIAVVNTNSLEPAVSRIFAENR
jgi:hypothetical protein